MSQERADENVHPEDRVAGVRAEENLPPDERAAAPTPADASLALVFAVVGAAASCVLGGLGFGVGHLFGAGALGAALGLTLVAPAGAFLTIGAWAGTPSVWDRLAGAACLLPTVYAAVGWWVVIRGG